MISERPAEVEDRAIPGHWEGDLVMGANSRSAIGTLVERSTRFLILLHLPDGHDAEHVQQAIIDRMGELPAIMRRSLTWDQESELALHKRITTALDMQVYFCDPHSPWQRGTNENTNGLPRQYFPKGTDLGVYPQSHLDMIAAKLNNRPRKTLDARTPIEVMIELRDADGKTVETVKNSANGKIAFTPVEFAKAGDYEYTIREVSGSATGVTYDKTVYTAKVSVVDNLDGTMSATATYSSGLFGTDHKAPAFENTFTPPLSKTGADMAGVMAMVLLLLGGGVTILMIERRNAAGLDVASSAPRGRHGR